MTGFQARDVSGTIPVGTTSAVVTATFADHNPVLGNYNGAFVDNLSFTVGDPTLTAAPLTVPMSNVGELDHVFLIYMENKGAADILDSVNAPYINSLATTYGYANNYYALGHPSDPNYFRIMGGSDFGIDYNPTSPSIDAPNLMQEMDATGVTWAGYAQGMPYPGAIVSSGDYAVDALPFAQFTYVYDNTPAYLQQHLLPLTNLARNLQNPATTPRFSWIAADGSTTWKARSIFRWGYQLACQPAHDAPVQHGGRRPVRPTNRVHHSKLAGVEYRGPAGCDHHHVRRGLQQPVTGHRQPGQPRFDDRHPERRRRDRPTYADAVRPIRHRLLLQRLQPDEHPRIRLGHRWNSAGPAHLQRHVCHTHE